MARPLNFIRLRILVVGLTLLGGPLWGAEAPREKRPALGAVDGRTAVLGSVVVLVGLALWGSSRARRRPHPTGKGPLRAIRLDSESIDAALGQPPAELSVPPILADSSSTKPSAAPWSIGTAATKVRVGNTPTTSHRAGGAAKPSVACRSRPAFSLEDRVYTLRPEQVASLLEAVYRKSGHEVDRPASAEDAGGALDLILSKDDNRTAVNCRHWKDARIGTPVVEELAGAMRTQGIGSGMILSLKGYTFQARTQAQAQGIRILDRPEILQLLEEAEATIDPALIEIVVGTPAPASA